MQKIFNTGFVGKLSFIAVMAFLATAGEGDCERQLKEFFSHKTTTEKSKSPVESERLKDAPKPLEKVKKEAQQSIKVKFAATSIEDDLFQRAKDFLKASFNVDEDDDQAFAEIIISTGGGRTATFFSPKQREKVLDKKAVVVIVIRNPENNGAFQTGLAFEKADGKESAVGFAALGTGSRSEPNSPMHLVGEKTQQSEAEDFCKLLNEVLAEQGLAGKCEPRPE